MHQVDIEKAKRQLADLVEAAMSGIEVIIMKDNRPVVKLMPLTQSMPTPSRASPHVRGLPTRASRGTLLLRWGREVLAGAPAGDTTTGERKDRRQ